MNRIKMFSIIMVIIFSLGLLGCEQEIKAFPSTPPVVEPPANNSSVATPSAIEQPKEPVTARHYYERAKTFSYKGDWEATLNDCVKAIELNPVYGEIYYLKGLALIGKKDYRRAAEAFDLITVGEEINQAELVELKKIANLVVPPGEIVLLDATCSYHGGKDCHGNYMPYRNTLKVWLFANPDKSIIEIEKISISPGIEGRSAIESPIKSFSIVGNQFLITNITSVGKLTNTTFSCSVSYKSKGEILYTKSNEINGAVTD